MKPAILLLMTTFAGYGQPGLEPPKYEVASIKPNTGNDFHFAFRIQPDGSLAATGITLKRLLMTAYNVQGFRIVGGPDWVASNRWDLQAKPNRVASPDEVRPMLRTLLEDRFRLTSHAESRKMPVYELAVGSKGSKLPRVKDNETKPVVRVTAGSIQLTRATPATFASQLSYALGQPVIDKTGLSGEFDFALEWTPETGENGGPTTAGLPPGAQVQPTSTPDRPSIFTAIPENWGFASNPRAAPSK
jgi:bla regulator protein blaR1